MLKRNRFYRKAAVLVDDLLLCGVDGMKLYLVVEVVAEGLEHHVEHRLKLLWRIYGKGHRSAQQTEGREHADKPEAVVAVYMTDEYSHYLVEPDALSAHLRLRSLATVNHKLLATKLHHLCRGVVP